MDPLWLKRNDEIWITLSCGCSLSYRPPTMTHDDQNKPFLCQNPPEMSCHSVLFQIIWTKLITFLPLCICQFFISLVESLNDWNYVWFISYSKFFNWRQTSKLSLNFECLFTFCYLDGANSIKTDLHICN